MSIEIGDTVSVCDGIITDKVTHIIYDYATQEPERYKVAGRYWNEAQLITKGEAN